MSDQRWLPVRAVDEDAFAAAREVLHHAAQVASALGATHLEADDDHQYANLGWSEAHQALLGRPVAGLQAGLVPANGCWILVQGDDVVADLPLADTTLDEALVWLALVVEGAGGPSGPLAPVGYEISDHPITDGAPFPLLDADVAGAVGEWFRSSARALADIADAHENASDVRCWPHHFDIATLITLEGSGESARTVGVGMTPGDGGIPRPYLYVTPWPYPAEWTGPELPVGGWVTEGWFGAVLDADGVLGADDQQAAVLGFVEAAIPAAASRAGG